MFTRKIYKKRALESLKGRWESAILVTFAVLLIEAAINAKNLTYYVKNSSAAFGKSSFFILAVVYFVLGTLSLAETRFYIKLTSSRQELGFSVFIEGFSFWVKGFLSRLWSRLWIVLWMCLFVIPGFVKAIAYSQMNYLLSDYPEMKVTQAMRISIIITRGHKTDLFFMYVSFLLWDILSLFTAGLLQLWVRPYKKTAFVYAYQFMVDQALKNGNLDPQDFYN